MAFYNRYGSGRHGFDDGPRGFYGGGDRFGGPGGRFDGPGRRDKPGGKTQRGCRAGKNKDKDGKRKHSGDDGPYSKKFKPGNNWLSNDRHPLMQPTLMDSKPENFEEDWLVVIRPLGRRRIVVSANNITQSYNSAQDPDLKFESCLPSGNSEKDEMYKQNDLTILDTVYSPENKEFYVVDMLHWRHYPYYESEADFRFYCLKDKWAQLKNPGETGSKNDRPLQLLSRYSCSNEEMEEALRSAPYRVDDLLFIKKSSLYNPGETSDCLRLKLDKVKDVLGFEVPEEVVKKRNESRKEEKKEKDRSTGSESKEGNQNSTEDKNNKSMKEDDDHQSDSKSDGDSKNDVGRGEEKEEKLDYGSW